MFLLPQASVSELLADSIENGQALLERASLIGDFSDYESWKGNRKLWIERTAETLARIYDGSQEVDDFRGRASAPAGEQKSVEQQWQVDYRRDSNCVRSAIDVLVSLRDALEPEPDTGSAGEEEPADQPEPEQPLLLAELEHEPADHAEPEPPSAEPEPDPEPESDFTFTATTARATAPEDGPAGEPSTGVEIEASPSPESELVKPSTNGSSPLHATTSAGPGANATGQVFLVHGRDDELKLAVADLLDRTGSHLLTILNERPGDHRMLVEHFEEHAAGSRYAVVLLTADDVGAPRFESEHEPYFSPRARQGVIFLMGVLVAALTPRCICVLYEDGVELPCDVDGIAYVRLDLAGTWQSKLLLHMRSAGFDYDLNMLAPI